jgi:hypothetical protein
MKPAFHPIVTTLRLFAVVSACGVIAITGCFKLARPTPPTEQFVLGGVQPAAQRTDGSATQLAAIQRDSGSVTIGLRRLDLAPYLASTAIIVRRGAQVSSSGFRRWAEEPAAGISRAIAGYLGASPRILAVDIAPWPVRAPHDFLVQVHVAHLEGVVPDDSLAATGEVHVQATWEIIRTQDGALLARGKTDRREGGWAIGDYRGLVSRLELGLNGLAGELTACLAKLSPIVPLTAVTEVMKTVECTR